MENLKKVQMCLKGMPHVLKQEEYLNRPLNYVEFQTAMMQQKVIRHSRNISILEKAKAEKTGQSYEPKLWKR